MNQVPQKLATASQRKRPGPARTPVLYSKQRLPSGLSQSERNGPCRWSTVQGFKGRTEMVGISLRSRASSVHTQQVSQSSLWADVLSHRQAPEWAGHMRKEVRHSKLRKSRLQTADPRSPSAFSRGRGVSSEPSTSFHDEVPGSSSTMLLTLSKL